MYVCVHEVCVCMPRVCIGMHELWAYIHAQKLSSRIAIKTSI